MHQGFKCLDISTDRIYISRDVVFDKNIFHLPSFLTTPSLAVHMKSSLILSRH
jgi:hypothetical protein